MAVYLYGTSALEYWIGEQRSTYHPYPTLLETLQHTFESAFEKTRVRALRDTAIPDAAFERLLSRTCRLTNPVHLLCSSASLRRPTALKAFHVWNAPLPRGAFYQVAPDVYVSSPAFCFLQLAPRLEALDLVQLGNELCGAYALSPYEAYGFRRCAPLTTPEAIRSFISRSPQADGSHKALRAAQQVVYGLASPMETAQHMILCLPRRFGGFGIAGAQVNRCIDMSLAVQARLDGDHCLCDLYWPEPKLAVEYNGQLAHIDKDRDAKRANRLASIGITTVTVTKDQLFDFEKALVLARQIYKHLGMREHLERLDATWRARAVELRKLVLPPNPTAVERVLAA